MVKMFRRIFHILLFVLTVACGLHALANGSYGWVITFVVCAAVSGLLAVACFYEGPITQVTTTEWGDELKPIPSCPDCCGTGEVWSTVRDERGRVAFKLANECPCKYESIKASLRTA